MVAWFVGLVVVAMVLAGCAASDSRSGSAPPASVPTSGSGATSGGASVADLADVAVTLRPVVAQGLDQPTAVAPTPDGREIWITEQGGAVRRVTLTSTPDPVTGVAGATRYTLDPDAVIELGSFTKGGGERGLLGMVFNPAGDRVYLYATDPTGDVVIAEYTVATDGARVTVDPSTRRVLLTIAHRDFANHNGGQLAFGPDGFLYAGVGDGGGSGDPLGNGQDTGELLGKILRIDPANPSDPSAPSAGRPYAIPASNPFRAGGGEPEIYLYGARNPWRFSFDRATGDLWVADVGQNEIEEINWLPATGGAGIGANLGWDWREGNRAFRDGTPPEGLVDPVFTYNHDEGNCSVTGGYVYRGQDVPSLAGVYVYGDFCVGEIRGLVVRDGVVVDEAALGVAVPGRSLTSFGQGVDGEIYVVGGEGALLKVERG